MNPIDPDIEIAAKRIFLRPVSIKYKEEIFREFTPAVTKYMPFIPNGHITVTEDFIRKSAEDLHTGTSLQLCILLKNSDEEFLGCCGLHHLHTKDIEIGLWLKIAAQGKGYGIETVQALINWVTEKFDFDQVILSGRQTEFRKQSYS
jgi:ribosomal-protein-alanine N-acetyltransferase